MFTLEISQWGPQTPWGRDKTFAACSTSCPTGSRRSDKRGLFQAAELGVLLDNSQSITKAGGGGLLSHS